MNIDELHDFFEEQNDEFIKFERVENKRSQRRDLHAFMQLDTWIPGDKKIIAAANHDIVYLEVSAQEVVENLSKDQIIELIRCGIGLDSEYDCLYKWA